MEHMFKLEENSDTPCAYVPRAVVVQNKKFRNSDIFLLIGVATNDKNNILIIL